MSFWESYRENIVAHPSSLPTLYNLKCWFSSRHCCDILENYKDVLYLLSVGPSRKMSH